MFRKTLFQNKYFKNIKNPLSFFRKFGRYQNLFFREFSRSIGKKRVCFFQTNNHWRKHLKFRENYRERSIQHSKWIEVSKETKQFVEACNRGDLTEMKALLRKGRVDINTEDSKWQTLLHRVSENGNYGLVEWLLKEGANVKALDKNDETPAHLALKNALGYIGGKADGRCIKFLLETGNCMLHNPRVVTDRYGWKWNYQGRHSFVQGSVFSPARYIMMYIAKHGFDSQIRSFIKSLHLAESFNVNQIAYGLWCPFICADLLSLAGINPKDIDILVYLIYTLKADIYKRYYSTESQRDLGTTLFDRFKWSNREALKVIEEKKKIDIAEGRDVEGLIRSRQPSSC